MILFQIQLDNEKYNSLIYCKYSIVALQTLGLWVSHRRPQKTFLSTWASAVSQHEQRLEAPAIKKIGSSKYS
jgi:hypothetical protein